MSTHVLIENTLVQQTRTRAWHCDARFKSVGALGQAMGFIVGPGYGLHSRASNSVHNASVIVLDLLKKKKKERISTTWRFMALSSV